MLYDIVTNLMVVFIVIIMTSTAYDSIRLFKCTKHWLDLLIGILSVIWIVFYVYVLVSEPKNAAMGDWVGRDFASWSEVYAAARQPWDEGVEIVERMVAELESVGLPEPKSRKRKSRFSEDDGDELDYDRLRTGQAFWRRCQRENMAGPQTVTLVVDVSSCGSVAHEDILWRGAAAIAITKVLEEAGFRVELWMARCSDRYGRDGLGTVVGVNLKRAGDPLDIATLIAAVSGWFFRSVVRA